MHVLEIETGRIGYADVLKHVRAYGARRSPRGLETIDAGPTTVVLTQPYDALPIGVGRRLNPKIAAAEAIQLVGEFSDPNLLPSSFDPYRDDDGSFHGAYGVRIAGQTDQVIRKISEDRDTRRAVINLWDGRLDHESGHRDYPCTVAIGFSVASRRLSMHVIMRSNDVWLGFPYDVFQFGQLQLSCARALGMGVGSYHHTAWSFHMYERDVEASECVAPGRPYDPNVDTPYGFGRPGDTWPVIRQRVRDIAAGRDVNAPTVDELWYERLLTGER